MFLKTVFMIVLRDGGLAMTAGQYPDDEPDRAPAAAGKRRTARAVARPLQLQYGRRPQPGHAACLLDARTRRADA